MELVLSKDSPTKTILSDTSGNTLYTIATSKKSSSNRKTTILSKHIPRSADGA